ncbi:hypothetical protein GWI34_35510 [Actinomadura sp. DSM 109109]|nr:hypothetical protein [Actinomadura lepetitiana]
MRCPNCGTESASSSPRCARCDAPLVPPGAGGAAGPVDETVDDRTRAPFGGTPGTPPPAPVDATVDDRTRDPFGRPTGSTPAADDPTIQAQPYPAAFGGGSPGEVPVPRDPVPPPWADQSPVQWEAQPDRTLRQPDSTLHMPPSEERTTHLSPEPWAEPWSEPAIWKPPAPPKRSTMPYFLGAAGVVLLIGLALGIVLWPRGSASPPATGTPPSVVPSEGVASASETPAGNGDDLDAQARTVDELLKEMGGTRSDLATVVTQGCPVSGVQRVLDARRSELEKARGLEVSALLDGEEMKAALVRALEASTESNQRYLAGAPGCPSESEVADVNQRASSAKSEFIGYWNVVAEKVGLPTRTESDI